MVKDPADERPTTIEFVLRTMLDVRAGEEVCVSYLVPFAKMSVEVRFSLFFCRFLPVSSVHRDRGVD